MLHSPVFLFFPTPHRSLFLLSSHLLPIVILPLFHPCKCFPLLSLVNPPPFY